MCPHWPGQQYQDDDHTEHLCEIIFEGPTGKETSAVNVPAVSGTGILAALQEARAAGITSKEEFFEMAEETGIKKVEDAVANPQLQETAAPQTGAPSTGWEDVLRAAGTDALLNASGLSAPARDLVRSSLGDSFEPDDVTAGIERVRAVLAKRGTRMSCRASTRSRRGICRTAWTGSSSILTG